MGITIIRTPLRYARAYNDGHSCIWVHDGLTDTEERCSITHEIAHITLGHVGEQPPEVEDITRKVTARWLVPWHRLATAWGDQLNVDDIAEELCVTPGVVYDRITHATAGELWELRGERCDWLAA